ncbi:CGNR zinc finger domain-containing protein [Kibdelosporangium persicum]|uniref:CGNR zinc finger n=1 Tax=Kibdelosporangium persicum TaxID=2698649 RepID=A0ABX2FCV4_9PSEU|nr:CGNR zinc finger domain-containing protein [Kibdelosporangium persicum]NRN68653.1 CGNR zinc finger [Kibdelosporangium persicum]
MGTDDVRLVLDFLNTVDYEDHVDHLDTDAEWRAWLAERRLAVSDRAHARHVRDAMRAAMGDQGGQATFSVPVEVTLQAGIPTLTGQNAVSNVLAAATRLALQGDWERVKICPAHDCRWAFYDQSRNRSRTWCSMRVCGNREKARAWRERARST